MNGYEALRNNAASIDLSARGKIRVVGEDRARLLHAMSTNHVQQLAPDQGLYAFFLNDKGRILADAYIYNLGESLFLDTEPEVAASLFSHLDRFIIADDVTLEDETASLAAIGLEGPKSFEIADQLGISVSETKFGIKKFDDGFTARVTVTGTEGFRIFVPAPEKDELLQRLESSGVPLANPDEVRTVRVENGTPRYGEDISERYLFQETQCFHAAHSNKGCYLGQEIVERVRARGQVHRLLTPIRIASESAPVAGAKLNLDGKDVAEITSAAYSPALHEVVGLAYVRSEALQNKPSLVLTGVEPPVAAFIR